MYQFLAFILSMFNTPLANASLGILYILFWIAVLAMSLSIINTWGFVHKTNEAFPKTSVFLASIGWIPYFSVIYAFLTVIIDYIVTGSNSLTVFLNNYMSVVDVYLALIGISILYAMYKVFYKHEDLNMSCYNYKQRI